MLKHIYFFFFLSILATSCAPKYAATATEPPNEIYAAIDDQNIIIELIYIGSTPTYHIFETQIKNVSSRELTISIQDFVWHELKKGKYQHPLSTDELELQLVQNHKKLKKEKKNRTIWSAVVTGLSILANSTTGISIGENLWYNTESLFYIFDERRWMQRNINSIEEELQYIQSHNLDREIIAPDEQMIKDVLFPISNTKGDVEIIYHHPNQDYILIFKESDFKPR